MDKEFYKKIFDHIDDNDFYNCVFEECDYDLFRDMLLNGLSLDDIPKDKANELKEQLIKALKEFNYEI